MVEHMFGRLKGKTEVYSVDQIPENRRTAKPSSVFFIWFASNLTVGDFAIGFIPVSLGLSLEYSIIAILGGTILGGILLSMMSILGPKTGLPQMAIGKQSFGIRGGSFLSALQWGNTAGWLTVNVILASFALFLAVNIPYYFVILLIVAIVAFTSLIGYRAIRIFEKAMSFVIGVMFVALLFFLPIQKIGSVYHAVPVMPVMAIFGITFASSFSYIMSWGPYASDYSRYIGREYRQISTFSYTLIGSSAATILAEITGMIVAILSKNPSGNPASDLFSVMGPYAIVGMLSLFLGGISANAINLYSNSLSFISIGIRVKRYVPIIIASVFSLILGIIGFRIFYQFYETFLFMLDYWITPWIAILVADFFIVNRKRPFNIRNVPVINARGILSYSAALLISIPFMAPSGIYEGPIAKLIGGFDISYFVSFFLAIVFYVCMSKFTDRHQSMK
ncbi:MAG: purine-cytosine permease family protein [Thermoplasmata archaeon]